MIKMTHKSTLSVALLATSAVTVLVTSGCLPSKNKAANASNELLSLEMQIQENAAKSPYAQTLLDLINANKPADSALVDAFLELHLNNSTNPTDTQVEDLRTQLKALVGGNQTLLKDLYGVKNTLETSLTNKIGSLSYNRDHVSLYDYFKEGRMQCYSGTSLFEAVRQLNAPLSPGKNNFVVIFEDGHVLPGFMEKSNEGYHLVGLETTVNGAGKKSYGPASELTGVRVVSANFFMATEIFETQLSNRQHVLKKALELTAQKYGIDLTKSEQSIDAITKFYTYDVASDGSAAAADEAKVQATLADNLNSSIFAFGAPNTPAGDQPRATAEEIQTSFRGSSVATGAGIALVKTNYFEGEILQQDVTKGYVKNEYPRDRILYPPSAPFLFAYVINEKNVLELLVGIKKNRCLKDAVLDDPYGLSAHPFFEVDWENEIYNVTEKALMEPRWTESFTYKKVTAYTFESKFQVPPRLNVLDHVVLSFQGEVPFDSERKTLKIGNLVTEEELRHYHSDYHGYEIVIHLNPGSKLRLTLKPHSYLATLHDFPFYGKAKVCRGRYGELPNFN